MKLINYKEYNLLIYYICSQAAERKVIMDLQKKLRGSMDYSELTQINNISG